MWLLVIMAGLADAPPNIPGLAHTALGQHPLQLRQIGGGQRPVYPELANGHVVGVLPEEGARLGACPGDGFAWY